MCNAVHTVTHLMCNSVHTVTHQMCNAVHTKPNLPNPPKDGEIALGLTTNQVDCLRSIACILVLPGSESIFTDITEFL